MLIIFISEYRQVFPFFFSFCHHEEALTRIFTVFFAFIKVILVISGMCDISIFVTALIKQFRRSASCKYNNQ